MSGCGYKGLLMGCSRPYWMGILQKIYKMHGTNKWSWNDIRIKHPEISNSDMRRLNCSNWFKKSGKDNKTSLWQLQPDAIRLCQIELSQPQVKKKLVKDSSKKPYRKITNKNNKI